MIHCPGAKAAVMRITCRCDGTTYIRRVKSLAHWLLAAFMAMNLTWGHDWVHVPQLFWHYQEHCFEEGDISFAEFITLHYGDRDHAESDGSHEDLPFQHHKDHGGVDHAFFAPIMKSNTLYLPTSMAGMSAGTDEPLDGHRPCALQPPRA